MKRERADGRWQTGRPVMVWAMALAIATSIVWAGEWRGADPDYAWSFPEDHWAHRETKTEWWYFTGHLQSTDGSRFGYQFTFFRVGVLPETPDFNSEWTTGQMVMGHAALSCLTVQKQEGEHRFSEVLYRATPLLGGFGEWPDSVLAWSRAPAGTDDRWELRWNGQGFDFRMRDDAEGFAFELTTRPVKPMVFQGPNGYSRKGNGPTAASLYYSFTRMATEGTLTVDGELMPVAGESWMDKEFGSNQLSADQTGWDWFSLQLDDRREVMLYDLRGTTAASAFGRGTVVEADGTTRYLTAGEFVVEEIDTWQSEATGARYPSGWRVRIPGADLSLIVTPELKAQENRSALLPRLFYWEGAVKVETCDGRAAGRGFVELTGYGTERVPAI